jgi:hypothetical protein
MTWEAAISDVSVLGMSESLNEGERIGNGSEASTMVRYATFRRFVDADVDADAEGWTFWEADRG